MKLPFLTAFWKDLIVLNYEVDPGLLQKYVPRGTELDLFEGKAFISLVAFRFEKNKLFGVIPSIPYSFEEINLRFYIKRGEKRAVAFVKEVVPSLLIASIARVLYQEPYVAMKTSSRISLDEEGREVLYSWGRAPKCEVKVRSSSVLEELKTGSLEEFILEHYWGYTPQFDGSTVEYEVKHPRWMVSRVEEVSVSEEIFGFYGEDFREVLSKGPQSVIFAEGSKVSVSLPGRFFCPLKADGPRGWVLYDGLCGFCSWWIPYWKNTIKRNGYEIAAVQTDWVRQEIGPRVEELNSDIRLLLNDGTLINGADAYIYGMRQVWWSWPFGFVLGLPIFRQITWKFYKVFNRNRFLVSKICKLDPEI